MFSHCMKADSLRIMDAGEPWDWRVPRACPPPFPYNMATARSSCKMYMLTCDIRSQSWCQPLRRGHRRDSSGICMWPLPPCMHASACISMHLHASACRCACMCMHVHACACNSCACIDAVCVVLGNACTRTSQVSMDACTHALE